MLILGVLFELVGVCTDSLYSLLGSVAGRWLTQNSSIQRWQRYITGSIYILLGVTTAVTGSEKR